jgi:phosphoglycerate dehydrogenase-like enzyme
MKIILCGTTFPPSREILAPCLPGDDVQVVERADVAMAVRQADVLIPMMTRLDPTLIEATSAALIQQWGAGLEGVDIDVATERGIFVCNVPSDETPNAESTAEHALLLMLGSARRLRTAARMFDEGTWGAPLGDALFGRRALIVGFGRIGRALARRLLAMGMAVDAIRRTPEEGEAARYGLERLGTAADLHAFAADADFVVCTATANLESRGMLDGSVFRVMRRSAILVNVGRGAIVDEPDLVDALREGRIAGAGLDVFADEPAGSEHVLVAMEQVLATPHIGGVTRQSYSGIAAAIAENVNRLKTGQELRFCVNAGEVTRARPGRTAATPPVS